ncbi:penicillin-binding transpeptidase domain-containing protein [Bacillus marasmi]|uniref:penicillin-binding transpeptidase domain-containing protein n=1 Tax=Bacillus marasmi TaxID=1926279 RepID=UPI0011CA6242|nr:penicillin-binding transpeptidase domain-containing protein [Bacillus marasmi]
MKKVFIGLISLIILVLLTSCNKEPSPENQFSKYIKLWNEQKFSEMYGYLSSDAKKAITKEEFVNRYKKIYSDLEITKIDVQFVKSDKETKTKEDTIKLPFSVKMETVAGPIDFDQNAKLIKEKRKDKENWYIEWNTGFIFPKLKTDDKIGLTSTPAIRGEILDRNGDPMAINGTAFQIGIIPEKMGLQPEMVISQLAELLQISPERIQNALNAKWVKPNFFVPVATISNEDTALLDKLYQIPGVDKQNTDARIYPFKESAAHLIGYTGPITADELEKLASEGYNATDVIGKRGLEQVLDKKLKGENGVKIFIKKADGKEVFLAEKPVKNGENITLTIDATLQQQIFMQFAGEAGTSAAIDPTTGETLALVSSPSFNPNKMAIGMSQAELDALQNNPQKPLLNRFKSTYAPGSVLKPITAAIGLTAGTLTPDTSITVNGLTWKKDQSWGKYAVTRVKDPNTPVNLEKALLYSDNIYFAQAALALGKNKFSEGLKQFGFDEEIPYLYPMEISKFGKMDSEIELADSGYGQGKIEVNVLQLATSYTPFLNNGNMMLPILTSKDKLSQVWKKEVVSEANANIISADLLNVVENPQGTAHSGKIAGMSIAGKTGTAELKLKQDEKGAELGWFVAYKTDEPHILIAMMVENVQERGGSRIPVEKVKNVLSQFGQAGSVNADQ